MTMTSHMPLTGAKGGASKPKTPVEAPDSLQSTNIAKLLLAVGEGEFDGIPTDQDIYLDNTPIRDANGALNFPGVKWEWRPGTPEQDYIQGIPAVENETSVGVELRSDTPFTRALTDLQLSAVRVRMAWPRLLSQDSNGNTNGYRIEYAIDIATDGGTYVEAHRGAVDGKTNNGYQRSVRVNLPTANSGWTMRVRRLTPNADKGAIADTMTIAGYTEIIDQKLRYPNTALLYIEFDAQQFQNIPAVTVDCKGRRWPVPSNYDPVTRRYDGVWDGSFKHAWTNNPAFVTYGLCVEDRFGLGKRIKPWMVDKWEMYRIAQFCDQAVPDGKGGEEPRFLCDMNLQGRAEAWTLLRDLSAIYRGMVYWAHGALFMQADMPRAQDIDYVFTRANVIDGDFVYGGAERNTHYSRALVSYDNPANNYDTDVIPVTDLALQRRYRDRPVEISAIGCTRASEAQRRGKWALLSNDQDRTVTFKTGLEGRIPLPGFVIPVADELVAGRPNGGRIAAAEGRVVTLDRDTPIKAGDRLVVNLPNGTAQARTVAAVTGRAVTVTTAYAVQPEPQLQWAIDYDDLAIQLFRVLKTTRTEDGHYAITALEFNPSKFAAIDNGAKLDERPISVLPSGTVQPPAQLTLSSSYRIDQGIAVSTLTLEWSAVEGAAGYDVEWRRDNGNWIRLPRTGMTSVDVPGIYAGAYLARVRAISAFELASSWTHSALTSLKGKEGAPPALTRLTTESLIFGIGLTWGFPAGAGDTQRTELWYSEGTDLDKATKLADLAYPQDRHTLQGLRAGQRFYFWARLVDKSGNVGVWFPSGTTLVTGVSSADAGPILEQIQGQVTESAIGQKLNERIDLVDGTGPGSVTERVTTASNAIKADVNKQLIQVNSTIDGVRSNLQGQITAVDGRVTTARDDLQKQISEVSSIAGALPYNKTKTYALDQAVLGANGKLYQAKKAVPVNMAPPNTDYWEDVGQSVRTANGTASAVSKLQMDVTTLGDTVTATSSKVDGFQASINTANSNASAAQGAAQAANDLAGGKGKVIVQNAAPAGADRLPQNLWIDTTSGANAPKRWNGSAWVSVSDKVATDAAAAAQSALNQVGSKADASAVNSLKLTVEQQGRDLTSQGSTLNGLQTAIDGKASSQALTQLTSRVKLTEDKNGLQDDTLKSQSESLTTLKDTVSKKAEASTVTQLANDVKTQGNTLSAQGSSLTRIEAGLPLLGGENLLANSSFEEEASGGRPKHWNITGSAARALVPSALTSSTIAARISGTPAAGAYIEIVSSSVDGRPNVKVTGGSTYTLTVYARGSGRMRMYLQFLDASTGVLSAPSTEEGFVLSDTFVRYALTGTAPAAATQVNVYACRVFNTGAAGTTVWAEVDNAQLQEGTIATAYQPSVVAAGDTAAQATTALAARVEKTEQGLTSASQQTTQLSNSLSTTNGNVDKAQKAAQDAYSLADAKGKVIVQNSVPSAINQQIQNLWIDTTGGGNTPKRWNGSAWAAVTDKVATDAAAAAQKALNQLGDKADASALSSLGSTVEQQGRDLTAAGRSVTELTASIGNVGSENLLYNPSLEAPHPSRAGLAAGWDLGNALANLAYSLVASTLDPAGNAIRLDLTINGGSSYVDLAPDRAYWPAVPGGQAMAMSGYFRATAGMIAQLYVQWFDAAGANIRTDGAASTAANGNWQRITLATAASPMGAVKARTICRIRGPFNGDTVSGFCEWDRMQFEVGDRVSGWRDNGQVNAAQAAANASATTALTSRVTKTEESLTSQSVDITQLKNTLSSGNFVAGRAWEMLNDNLGWYATAADATLTPGPLFSTMRGGNSNLQVNINPAKFSGAENPIVRFRMRRRNTTRVGCRLYWANEDGGLAETRMMPFDVDVSKSDWQEIEIDLSGNSAWVGKTGIYALRLDMTTTSDTKAEVDIAYVAAGRKSVAASSQVVALLGSVVSQQGRDIESTGRQTVELQNSLTTTDGNVTKAQTAADAASKLAGGKGKVIVQSGAPGADDRLPQNLWIDITGEANTPKRWNGSAWAAVTDKVATDAAAAAQNALNQLGSKADAKALTDLTTRVKDTEDGLSTQASQLTVLGSSIGSAQPFVAGVSWEFINSVRGWVANAADGTITAGPAFATIKKPTNLQATNTFGKIVGAENPYLRIRLRRRNTTRDRAAMYWANEDGGLAENRRIDFSISLSSTDWQDIEVDLSSNTQWVGKTGIYAIRLDMTGSANTACEIDIAYIAIGRRSAAASAQAVSLLETAVTQQGGDLKLTADSVTKLTGELGKTNGNVTEEARLRVEGDKAQASKTDKVQTNLDTTNGTVKTVSDAVVKLDGKVNTSFSVRLQASAGGTHYAAGFGIGLDNNAGTFQSSFVVKADRFVVMNPVGEGLITPFAIQNGQVFINDALISNLAVQRAVVGSTIGSQALTSYGAPRMTLNFNGGEIIIQNNARSGRYIHMREDGIFMVSDGIIAIELSL
ncbi:phage tail protein [Pseudomonas alabamensis]|uniref:TipJ family phage tail tip protein n=1 Tax=Pseudomonas alabamensis TaxID=3064349 RepID=UPI000A2F279D